MPAPANLTPRPRTLQFYSLLVVTTYFGVARGGLGLVITTSDLLLHFFGYTVLMLSGMLAHGKHPLRLFAGLLVYSIAIEIIQYFLPYRTFSLTDILANLAGLGAGSLFWWLGKRYHHQKLAASNQVSNGGEQG